MRSLGQLQVSLKRVENHLMVARLCQAINQARTKWMQESILYNLAFLVLKPEAAVCDLWAAELTAPTGHTGLHPQLQAPGGRAGREAPRWIRSPRVLMSPVIPLVTHLSVTRGARGTSAQKCSFRTISQICKTFPLELLPLSQPQTSPPGSWLSIPHNFPFLAPSQSTSYTSIGRLLTVI